MLFKEWLLNERTLYHGTIVDNEKNIRDLGIMGGVGHFVATAYDEEPEHPEIAYASDKKTLKNSLTAMVAHIAHKLKKDFHDVTDNDILNHGLIVTIEDTEDKVPHRAEDDENYYGQHPSTVEPGDYYDDYFHGTRFIKGKPLLRLFKRYGAWPRMWGQANSQRINLMKAELIRQAIQKHPDKSRKEIINKANQLSADEIEKMLRSWRYI